MNRRDSIGKSSNFAGLAPADGEAFAFAAVKQPVINVDDKAAIQRGIDRAAGISRRMASCEIRVPRGVYRFKTHEEADEWWDKVIERSEPKRG